MSSILQYNSLDNNPLYPYSYYNILIDTLLI